MKITFSQFQAALINFEWTQPELANKLSAIGFETEVSGDTLDITLTSNRKDCQDKKYLFFDLAGIYNLSLKENSVNTTTDREIPVTLARINKLLGTNFTDTEYRHIESLGFVVKENAVAVPAFRVDITTAADIAEEVIRLHGFDRLQLEPLAKQSPAESTEYDYLQTIKFALCAAGWTETATYSFAAAGDVKFKNPFRAEEPYLRSTLQEGLLQTLAKNPFMKRAKFFELGSVFNPDESIKLGLICSGYKDSAAIADQLSQILGQSINLQPVEGVVAARYEAKQGSIFWAEISCTNLELPVAAKPVAITASLPAFTPISKYPPLVRDVTVTTSTDDCQEAITRARETFPELLLAEIIDEYTNPTSNEQSTTLRFIFQKMDGSFTQKEIEELSSQLTSFLN